MHHPETHNIVNKTSFLGTLIFIVSDIAITLLIADNRFHIIEKLNLASFSRTVIENTAVFGTIAATTLLVISLSLGSFSSLVNLKK